MYLVIFSVLFKLAVFFWVWDIQSIPRPHAFANLPLQSGSGSKGPSDNNSPSYSYYCSPNNHSYVKSNNPIGDDGKNCYAE